MGLIATLPPLLAGAVLVGLAQVLLHPGLDTGLFWREGLLLVLAGDCAVALLAAGLIGAVCRLAHRSLPGPGTAFLLGASAALPPFLACFFSAEALGWLALPAGVAAALLLGRHLPLRPRAAQVLAALALAAFPVLWLLPAPSLAHGPQPPLPEPAADAPAPPAAPDILLVSVDTLRADRILDLEPHLPNFTALRRRGLWHEYALSSSNQTAPAHVTMLSGLGALEHGVRNTFERMGPGVPLISQRLEAAGWRTAGVVSNGCLRAGTGFERGFQAYDDSAVAIGSRRSEFRRWIDKKSWIGWCLPEPQVRRLIEQGLLPRPNAGGNSEHTAVTERALRYMQQLQQGPRPYFLFVHYIDPHHPYSPTPAVAGTLAKDEPLPAGYDDPWQWDQAEFMRGLRDQLQQGRSEPRSVLQHLSRMYDEEILSVDAMLGRLLEQIERSGRPTVVLVTSDHGEHFGEHACTLHSCSLYEELVRVPMLLAGPGIPARHLEHAPHLEDVVPTLLEVAGLPATGFAGQSLLSGELPERPYLERYNEHICVRDAGWKLVAEWRWRNGRNEVLPRELYHVDEDPAERDNRLAQEPEIVARLSALAQDMIAASGARPDRRGRTDASDALFLDELGYAGEEH